MAWFRYRSLVVSSSYRIAPSFQLRDRCVRLKPMPLRSFLSTLIDSIVAVRGSLSYLGEELGPDGLNLLDVGSLDEGVDLVGLYHFQKNPS